MDKNKHRHVFVIRILPRRYADDHNEKYTGFLKIFFYDPTSRETYLEYYDWDDVVLSHPYRIGKDAYLFSEFTYQNPDTGEIISQDYTHTKAYPLPRDKEYDPPEGIKLCAELNLRAFKKAYDEWKRLENKSDKLPVSTRATGIVNHYKRVVADFRQWYIENCPEYLPRLSSLSTEISTEMPNRSREDTKWLRENAWPELQDRLYDERKIALDILLNAADEIPGGRAATLTDDSLFNSFCAYVNRRKRKIQGKISSLTARVDHNAGIILLGRKRKK